MTQAREKNLGWQMQVNNPLLLQLLLSFCLSSEKIHWKAFDKLFPGGGNNKWISRTEKKDGEQCSRRDTVNNRAFREGWSEMDNLGFRVFLEFLQSNNNNNNNDNNDNNNSPSWIVSLTPKSIDYRLIWVLSRLELLAINRLEVNNVHNYLA